MVQSLKELAPYLTDEYAMNLSISIPDINERYSKNPYCLLDYEIDDCINPTFDEIDSSVILKTFEDRKREVKAALTWILKRNEIQGDSYMYIDVLCKQVKELLDKSSHPLLKGNVIAFLNYYSDYFALDYSRNIVSRLKTKEEEWQVYYGIKSLKENSMDFYRYRPIDKSGILDDSQLFSALNVIKCKENIALLTGGPGTGKTTTTKAIVDGLNEFYPELNIVLLAPTGKAASRMQEVYIGSDVKIKTIHMFTGFREEGQNTNTNIKKIANDIKSTNIIIVDEASMVQQEVLARLFQFVNFKETKIIFVGDEDQLDAVGCGDIINVLKKMGVHHEHLTVNYRSASAINVNASRINRGITEIDQDESFEFIDISNYNIEEYLIEDMVYKTNEGLSCVLLNPYKATSRQGNIRDLNKRIQIKRFGNGPYCSSRRFENNDRVIITHTNYAKKYFNGYTGSYVGYDAHTDSYKVLLDYLDKVILVNNDCDIALNYAQTIHKSQGSEYDFVDVYIPEFSSFITRRSLYTALTRAKKKARIFTTPDIYKKVIANIGGNRKSYINIWLEDEM